MIDPARGAHGFGEPARVVVGMVVAERVLRVSVQILPVSMNATARLMSGSAGMAEKITPPGPCGESGGDQLPGIIVAPGAAGQSAIRV